MASPKSFLLNLLVDVLGNYVEGLTAENLKIGVWAGKIELLNLKLKSTALDDLHLPIVVTHGSLKRLVLKVPWTALESKPVKVILDGIYLQASPIDLSTFNSEDIKKYILSAKLSKLKEIETKLIAAFQNPQALSAKAESTSYFTKLATKIMDNIEISIKNVHIRYLDANSIPETVVCAGITIDSLTLATTDENWLPKFVARDTTKKNTGVTEDLIRKLGELSNLGLYWKVDAKLPVFKTSIEWEEHMTSFLANISAISGSGSSSKERWEYILLPPNKISMKIVHRDASDENTPKIDCEVECLGFDLRADRLHVQQFLSVQRFFGQLDRQKLMASYRPLLRPKADPKGWWKYAVRLVLGSDLAASKKFEMIHKCIMNRGKYIDYVKRDKINREDESVTGGEAMTIAGGYPPLSELECAELSTLELSLPLVALLQFHQTAISEALNTIETLRLKYQQVTDSSKNRGYSFFGMKLTSGTKQNLPQAHATISTSTNTPSSPGSMVNASNEIVGKKQKTASKSFTSWFSSKKDKNKDITTSSPVKSNAIFVDDATPSAITTALPPLSETLDEEDENDLILLKLEEKLLDITSSSSVDDKFTFRMTIKLHTALNVTYDKKPLIFIDFSLLTLLELRSGGLFMRFDLNNWTVEDMCTHRPLNKYLIRLRNEDNLLKGSGGLISSNKSHPQCMVIFELKDNKSSLKVSTMPLEVCWNENCIRKLIALLTISSNGQSPVSVSPALIASMNRFAAEVALPMTATTIDIEVYAPKFVLPEDCSVDNGCIILDTGFLKIFGSLEQTGMSWDIKLQSVNVGTLSSVLNSDFKNETYVVKPFDILMKIMDMDRLTSDLEIDLKVAPKIETEFDATKIIRTLAVVNTVMRSLDVTSLLDDNPTNTAMDSARYVQSPIKSSTISDGAATSNPLHTLHSRKSSVHDMASIPPITRKSVYVSNNESPTIVKVRLRLNIEIINLRLKINNNHYLDMIIRHVNTTVIQRVYDMTVEFHLSAISVENSMRSSTDKNVLYTPNLNDQQHFIHIIYTCTNNRLSPLFRGYQSQLDVKFAQLRLALDEAFIRGLNPFLINLLHLYGLQQNSLLQSKSISDSVMKHRSSVITPIKWGSVETATELRNQNNANQSSKIYVSFQFDSISLDLLRNTTVPKTSNQNIDSAIISGYQVSISKLSANLDMKKNIIVNLKLNSFEISDCRTESADFVYRTIVSRSSIGDISLNVKNNDANKLRSGSEVSYLSRASEQYVQTIGDNILMMHFEDDSDTNVSDLRIIIQDITSFISVDIVLDLIQLILLNTNALTDLLSILTASNAADSNSDDLLDRDRHGLDRKSIGGKRAMEGKPSAGTLFPVVEDEEYAGNIPQMSRIFNVSLNVMNPRLIFLDDPQLENTKAIISDCRISLHYVKDTKDTNTSEVRESLHLSLQDAEVFVLTGIKNGFTQQIIQPTSIDLHFKKLSESDVVYHSEVIVSTEEIITNLSLNDIVLTSSIIARRSLANSFTNNELDTMQTKEKTVAQHADSNNNLTMFIFRVNVPKVDFVLINDFNTEVIPIFKTTIDNFELNFSGALQDMAGDGALLFSSQYYNNAISQYEPVIERWYPNISLTKDHGGIECEISSSDTLQFNISGALTKCAYEAAALVSRIGKEGSYGNRIISNSLSIKNYLGIPIALLNSRTKEVLIEVNGNSTNSMPIILHSENKNAGRIASHSSSTLPSEFDVVVLGKIGEGRLPLMALPLNINRPKRYVLQPPVRKMDNVSPSVTSNQKPATPMTSGEPIVEVVYEYSRYYALQGKWLKPWPQLNDPPQWADGRGKIERTRDSIILPPFYTWMDEWKVDMSGRVGKEMDSEGWEYANTFGQFTLSSIPRTKQSLDVVRRRKWVRTRAVQFTASNPSSNFSKNTEIDDANTDSSLKPLSIFWDVSVKADGSREISVKSAIQFKNTLPCELSIQLISNPSNNSNSNKILTIKENESINIPLLYSNVTDVRFTLLGLPYDWSESVSCKLNQSDNHDGTNDIQTICCKGDGDILPMFIRICRSQINKSLLITCSPPVVIYNRLPCSISFSAIGTMLEELSAGSHLKLTQLDMSKLVQISFQLGIYYTNTSIPLTDKININDEVEFAITLISKLNGVEISNIENENNNGDVANASSTLLPSVQEDYLSFTMKSSLTSTGTLEVTIYAKYLLIDKSHSNICIRSKRFKSADLTKANEIFERHTFDAKDSIENEKNNIRRDLIRNVSDHWIYGFNGKTLFQAIDSKISIGIKGGQDFIHNVSLLSLGSAKSTFEITSAATNKKYHLAYSVSPLLSVFSQTNVLTIMPCYNIVNYTNETLELQTYDADYATKQNFIIPSKSLKFWYEFDACSSTSVRIKSNDTDWSLGVIDINDIGSSVMVLPKQYSYGHDLNIINIEVKFSDITEDSYITVIIWKAEVLHKSTLNTNNFSHIANQSNNAGVPLSIKNETNIPIIVRQYGCDEIFHSIDERLKFDLCLPPNAWEAYGWTDPNGPSKIAVYVGTSGASLEGNPAIIDTCLIGVVIPLNVNHLFGHEASSDKPIVRVIVTTVGSGKVVQIFQSKDRINDTVPNGSILEQMEMSRDLSNRENDVTLKLDLYRIGVSIIAERPNRREFFSIHATKLNMMLRTTKESLVENASTLFSFNLMDFQIDNFSESAIHPVLLSSDNSSERIDASKRKKYKKRSNLSKSVSKDASVDGTVDDEDDDLPCFIQCMIIREVPAGQFTPVYKYVGFRVLEIKAIIDSSTILLYFADIHSDLFKGLRMTGSTPITYIAHFNDFVGHQEVESDDNSKLEKLEKLYALAQQNKSYFEQFIIHPIKITLGFVSTPFPRSSTKSLRSIPNYKYLKRIQNITAFDDLEIKIHSFIASNFMESFNSLTSRISKKAERDIKAHLAEIIGSLFGSLSLLGKPAGLVKNIGNGVQDFFYEPYLGLMESPKQFALGLKRGTGSLITGVVTGALSSTATIIGTATGGLARGAASVMQQDSKFIMNRKEKLRQQKSAPGGLVSGIKAGGESIVTGITSGITGLVTTPIEEGKKGGAMGFIRGVGMGVVGAALKPVIGITDGISSVAMGVTEQMKTGQVLEVVRPQRALERSIYDSSDLILVTVDVYAAIAQELIVSRAQKKNYYDSYQCLAYLGFKNNEQDKYEGFVVVISDNFVFLLRNDVSLMWSMPFSDISHFVLMNYEQSEGLSDYRKSIQ
eukprot:gene8440-11417_t